MGQDWTAHTLLLGARLGARGHADDGRVDAWAVDGGGYPSLGRDTAVAALYVVGGWKLIAVCVEWNRRVVWNVELEEDGGQQRVFMSSDVISNIYIQPYHYICVGVER